MKALHRPEAIKNFIWALKKKKKKIGFVPTLGFLHEGHLSLVRRAKKENDAVVVSIFVNPLQFGPKEDLSRYPRDLKRDKRLLEKAKTDLLFVPEVKDFYPIDFQTSVSVCALSRPLCGISRPTHFAGVATVVLKLLNFVQPHVLYLGQKDYQQCCVIGQMVKDLGVSVSVRVMPIVRELDGLAMSSRNIFLTTAERQEAVLLYQSLQKCRRLIKEGCREISKLKTTIKIILKGAPHARTDYIEIVNAETLESMVNLNKGSEILIALAVYFSKTRLIDNIKIKV